MSKARAALLIALWTPALALAAGAEGARVRTAASARPDLLPLALVPEVAVPPVEVAHERVDDALREALGLAPRFAVGRAVRLDPAGSGAWEALGADRLLWRLTLRAAGATSLNLGFSRFRLPEGAALRLVGEGLERVVGPFTAADNEEHGELWTPLVPGERVTVELELPLAAARDFELELATVNVGYRAFGGAPGAEEKSGSCNVDVACPEAGAWAEQVRSVAAISLGGSRFCTGFLVNNTALDRRPLFLTAEHCDVEPEDAPSLVAYWRYENSTCRPPGSAESGLPGDGVLSVTNTGAVWRADWDESDFSLVELDDPVNPAADAFLAGWDRSATAPSSAVTIHHPNGQEKRISFENDPLSVTAYLGSTGPGDGTHLRVADWDLGTTEGGSSGSPLFNGEKRVVGQLHGGYAACGNELADWYGRLASSWSGGGTATSRLSGWLDPAGTGATTLDGLPATAVGNPPAAPTGLVATPISATEIALSWHDNSGSESGYRVEMRLGGGSWTGVATLAANTGSATIGGLAPVTAYGFRVQAFNAAGGSGYSNEATATTLGTTAPCLRDASTACLVGGRFEVKVTWQTAGDTGSAQAMSFGGQRAESDESIFWWFFSAANFEMGVKVLDGCGINSRFWVFVSGLTDQAFTVTIRDTLTGAVRIYSNALNHLPQTVGDTSAFPCP